MVRPILEYASPVWDPYQQTDIKALEQVQRRAARYVFNGYSTRTPGCVTKMLDDLEWDPLEVRRRHNRLSMLYRMQHNLVDIPANRYQSSSDSRTRGTVKCSKKESAIQPTPTPSNQGLQENGTNCHPELCLQPPWKNSGHPHGCDLLHHWYLRSHCT